MTVRMDELRAVLERHVGPDGVPGAVALIARGADVHTATVGLADVENDVPMMRDSIFRLASITKPVVAAAVLHLVDDGRLALDDPIGTWLPELADPRVVRTPDGPLEDTVPADRQATVRELLTFTAGWGFGEKFDLPVVAALFRTVHAHILEPQLLPAPADWLAALAEIPMLHQPGEAWLYNTCSDIQGVLVERVTGQALPDVLRERLFEPLSMVDTDFEVPADKRDRFVCRYANNPDGTTHLADGPDGHWSKRPAFASGGAGLVSTVDDWYAFGWMLLNRGRFGDRQILSEDAVAQMTSDQLTPDQRRGSNLFLEGQSWGFGGSVDVDPVNPWNTPGRYGWVGGTGTSAHIDPVRGTVAVLLTQRDMTGPTAPPIMRDFWRLAAGG
jgi:CubicO group peptidase (beta-lactamase class C family)